MGEFQWSSLHSANVFREGEKARGGDQRSRAEWADTDTDTNMPTLSAPCSRIIIYGCTLSDTARRLASMPNEHEEEAVAGW